MPVIASVFRNSPGRLRGTKMHIDFLTIASYSTRSEETSEYLREMYELAYMELRIYFGKDRVFKSCLLLRVFNN